MSSRDVFDAVRKSFVTEEPKNERYVIHCGSSLEVLKRMPSNYAHCCVTSPPYWGLRDYGTEGQIGLEPTPEEYVARLVGVFREVRRVLRDDGTLWLNLGDSYAANRSYKVPSTKGGPKHSSAQGFNGSAMSVPPGLKPKDLCGIPWLVAFALRADGWYLRSDIIWSKLNPMPESVTDRPTKAHEYLFLLSKSERYYYDHEAVKEDAVKKPQRMQADPETAAARSVGPMDRGREGFNHQYADDQRVWAADGKRNRRDVWTIATRPYKGAHFATFPPALVEPCIKAGTSEHGVCAECGASWERVMERREVSDTGAAIGGDPSRHDGGTRERDTTGRGGNQLARTRVATADWRPTCSHDAAPVPAIVLDPFFGSGTTGAVALKHGRRVEGIELNPEYVRLAEKRLAEETA